MKAILKIEERASVGIFGYNCFEWVVVDFACAYN